MRKSMTRMVCWRCLGAGVSERARRSLSGLGMDWRLKNGGETDRGRSEMVDGPLQRLGRGDMEGCWF